jgi:hypothetical protein
LNDTPSAIMPANPPDRPDLHFMNALSWLKRTGLVCISAQSFAADIMKPQDEAAEEGICFLMEMFWGRAEKEVSEEIWQQFKGITDPKSGDYILSSDGYSGVLTYTMFTGEVPE